MTDRTTPDKRRALDAVIPPDQWDDIVARADGAELLDLADARDRGRSSWVLGAAAAVLVLLVAAIGVVALRDDGDGGGDRIAAEGGDSPWGARWRLESITENGLERPALTLDDRGAPVLDLTIEGTVALTACNRGGGEGRIADGRLVLADGFMMTAAGCLGPDETSPFTYMDQESFLRTLMRDRPTVERDGDRIVLTADDGRVARFVRVDERDPATMFGRRWTAVAVTVDGQVRDLHTLGGLVLQFDGPSGNEATFPGLVCVPPYEGPIDGDAWSPHATATLDCDPRGMDERNDWLTRLLDHPGVTAVAGAPVPVTVAVDGDRLTLSHDSARFDFVATQNPEGLVGKVWTVARIEQDGVEQKLLTDKGAEAIWFRVSAAGGGTLAGREVLFGGGCNGKSAAVTFDGDRLVVPGSFGSTLKLCAGPGPTGNALQEQDAWLATFLADDPLVAFQGDRLTLWTADRRVELAGDGSVGAPIDPPDGSPVEGPDGSISQTTTGPDGSVGGPIGSGGPTNGPEGTDDFWGRTWLVTGITIDGVAQPMVDAGDGRPYVTIETQQGTDVPIRIEGCEIADLATATWDGGFLVAGGPSVAVTQECGGGKRQQQDRIIDVLTGRPRSLGFVDATGPGWTFTSGTVSIELREAGSFSFAFWACGPTDGREAEVRLGRDVGGVGPVRIALVQGDGPDAVLAEVRKDPASAAYDDRLVLAGFTHDPRLGPVELRISPVDALDELLVDRPVVDLGIQCG